MGLRYPERWMGNDVAWQPWAWEGFMLCLMVPLGELDSLKTCRLSQQAGQESFDTAMFVGSRLWNPSGNFYGCEIQH